MNTRYDAKGVVLDIQRFCLNDGPGIRTTVFLKGCPLRCIWCHNPESKRFAPEILFSPEKCIGCGECFRTCGNHALRDGAHDIRRDQCTGCGRCEKACAAGALRMAGKPMSVADVLSEVSRDRIFYEKEGGVTLSGGEPLAQPEFALALLEASKEAGICTAVESCLFCPEDVLRRAAALTDVFLADYKETDPALHEAYTGKSNGRTLENLALLDALGARVILRCPIIPGKNDREDHFAGIATAAEKYGCIKRVEIEPYHAMGRGKAAQLEAAYEMGDAPSATEEQAQSWIQNIAERTRKTVKRG